MNRLQCTARRDPRQVAVATPKSAVSRWVNLARPTFARRGARNWQSGQTNLRIKEHGRQGFGGTAGHGKAMQEILSKPRAILEGHPSPFGSTAEPPVCLS